MDQEIIVLAMQVAGAIIALGVFISRYTKTDKDDAFFARVKGVFPKLSK